tara:strand:+ start:553 stop:684 length:132 start_codon:yes stop_codon:yes gene_type:complete
MIVSILIVVGVLSIGVGTLAIPEDRGSKLKEETFRKHFLQSIY